MSEELAETPAPAAAETSVPSTDENKTDAPAEGQPPDAEPEQKPEPTEAEKIRTAMQKRIDRLTAKSSETERQYQEVMSELQKLKQPSKDRAPKESDYETTEEYLIAKGKFEAKQELAAEQAQKTQEEQAKAYQEKLDAHKKVFEEKEAEIRKTTPDYDEAVDVLNEYVSMANPKSAGFQVFRDVLMSAPDMPALTYHLGKNPDLMESMLKMEPAQIAWTLIETAIKLRDAPKPQKTPVSKPPTPTKASSNPNVDPDKMTTEEWLEWRRSTLKRK